MYSKYDNSGRLFALSKPSLPYANPDSTALHLYLQFHIFITSPTRKIFSNTLPPLSPKYRILPK